jgi:hypothetical protein
MRLLLLTTVFFFALYQLAPRQEVLVAPKLDQIKLKISAPARVDRLLTAPQAVSTKSALQNTENALAPESSEDSNEESENLYAENDQIEEVAVGVDPEKGWEIELKNSLNSLEPESGEEIFSAYVSLTESYQSELDDLIKNNQKNPDLEELIDDLENKHEEKIKEIFGRHYEELKNRQSEYQDALSQSVAE